jgi:hypothetical protein
MFVEVGWMGRLVRLDSLMKLGSFGADLSGLI